MHTRQCSYVIQISVFCIVSHQCTNFISGLIYTSVRAVLLQIIVLTQGERLCLPSVPVMGQALIQTHYYFHWNGKWLLGRLYNIISCRLPAPLAELFEDGITVLALRSGHLRAHISPSQKLFDRFDPHPVLLTFARVRRNRCTGPVRLA